MSEIAQPKNSSNAYRKGESVTKHKNSMTMNLKKIQKVKIELIIMSSYKMTAQLMTSNANNVDDCKMHME